MSQKIKPLDRLEVALRIAFPDINKGLSYKAKERKIKLYIDGTLVYTYDMDQPPLIDMRIRLRAVITATQVFEKTSGEEIDLTQKYIVGQNFIEATFPKTGKTRRKSISFHNINQLTLLQPQDFWK